MNRGRHPPTIALLLLIGGCGLYIPSEEHLARVDRDLDGVSALDDCDDEDPTADIERTWYLDGDGDGVGGEESAVACNPPTSHVTEPGDCDDTNPDYALVSDWYVDADHDGWGTGEPEPACGPPVGKVAEDGDCDDADPLIHPEAIELCNLLDDDCDDQVDDGAIPTTWYVDADGDGFGDDATAEDTCDPPESGVLRGGDCDDASHLVNPEAIEYCNGRDDDCDGAVDAEDPSMAGDAVWYVDDDGDGWGNGNLPAVTSCQQPDGYVEFTGDCDDALTTVHPDHDEICDDLDNDCDTLVDDDDPDRVGEIWFYDLDGDGWGDAANTVEACVPPPDATDDDTDCDDTDASIHPDRAYEIEVGAPGECGDGRDNDCDTFIDAADDDCADRDSDGIVNGVDAIFELDCKPAAGVECLCARADLLLPDAWETADAIHVVRGVGCFGLCDAPVSSLSLADTDALDAFEPGSWCWDFSAEPPDTYVFRWVSSMSAADPAKPVNPNSCSDWKKIDLDDTCDILGDPYCIETDGVVEIHVDTCDSGATWALEVNWNGSSL